MAGRDRLVFVDSVTNAGSGMDLGSAKKRPNLWVRAIDGLGTSIRHQRVLIG